MLLLKRRFLNSSVPFPGIKWNSSLFSLSMLIYWWFIRHHLAWQQMNGLPSVEPERCHQGRVQPCEALTDFSSDSVVPAHSRATHRQNSHTAGCHTVPGAFAWTHKPVAHVHVHMHMHRGLCSSLVLAHRYSSSFRLQSPAGLECDLLLQQPFSNKSGSQTVSTTMPPCWSVQKPQCYWLLWHPAEPI